MSDANEKSEADSKGKFNEHLAIMDDQTWIWSLVSGTCNGLKVDFVRLPSTVPIRQSWERLKNAGRMIVHWESKQRSGGAVVEEILDTSPNFDVAERIIVLTTNPTHEDVVYFSELGIRRIIKVRQRDKDILEARRELEQHLTAPPSKDPVELAWRKALYLLDTLPDDVDPDTLAKIESTVHRLKPDDYTARYLDAIAKIAALKGEDDTALKAWLSALDRNPNYYRTYHNLTAFYRKRGRPQEALGLMQKMQELNKSNISRLVGMGEIQMELNDQPRAEFYFKSALERDQFCSGALNGLAEIRFHQGNLEESRRLLAKSQLAYKTASNLNKTGIDLVKKNKFADALDHYTRAQYVLPQQDKGPLLFYNIGLCYSRWGKLGMAREFLKIALIKEPSYKKARRLLEMVESRLPKDLTGTA